VVTKVKKMLVRAISDIFGWDEYLHVVSLLPLGYPAEEPAPGKSLMLEEILL
jgi:nitroreductase